MRLTRFLTAAALAAASCIAFAQTDPPNPATTKKHPAATTSERPVDVGPYTPDANKAYQGGGVVLQGPPGAPPPQPAPTPPGQPPRNAVPQSLEKP